MRLRNLIEFMTRDMCVCGIKNLIFFTSHEQVITKIPGDKLIFESDNQKVLERRECPYFQSKSIY